MCIRDRNVRAATATVPPVVVWRSALSRRLPRTSWIRSGSAMTAGIDAGESEVEHDQIGFRLARQSDRRLAVASGPYVEPVLGQVALDDAYQARLVIVDAQQARLV